MIVDESKTKPNNKECSESKKELICGLYRNVERGIRDFSNLV